MTKLNPNVTSPSGIAATLTPFLSALRSSCERAEVVGPVRRGELSTEADFIAVPRQLTVDLFGSPEADTAAIEECLRKWGTMSRRNDGAFVVLLRHPIDGAPSVERVNVALVPEDVEWGLAVLRGTGPADYVRDLLSKLEERGPDTDPGRSQRVRRREGDADRATRAWKGKLTAHSTYPNLWGNVQGRPPGSRNDDRARLVPGLREQQRGEIYDLNMLLTIAVVVTDGSILPAISRGEFSRQFDVPTQDARD
jgi:hypothetical protein